MMCQIALILFFQQVLPVYYKKEYHTKNNLNYSRSRCCKPDFKQRNRLNATHKIRYRHSYAKCTDYPLTHNKKSFPATIKISYKRKQKRYKHTVDCIGFKIFRRSEYNLGIWWKNSRKNWSVWYIQYFGCIKCGGDGCFSKWKAI